MLGKKLVEELAASNPTPSGMELMLRSMGLGQVSDAAKALVSSGAVEKIVRFSEEVEQINGRLANIERLLAARADPGPGGAFGIAAGTGEPLAEQYRTAGGHGLRGVASRADDGGHVGDVGPAGETGTMEG